MDLNPNTILLLQAHCENCDYFDPYEYTFDWDIQNTEQKYGYFDITRDSLGLPFGLPL